ncbi:2-phosphosulfolactate phosphatase [Microbacterium gorillae]|uniref:2-phosphosulfolactate phosphatase n=1 Tax=Microbacterium gorillae TaxID=1231063 RepID=UPI00069349FD|nr:2-phosphosulfolactate phosphatase [Microbacterium gorillae]
MNPAHSQQPPTDSDAPFAQSIHRVRTEWGVPGLGRLAPADVVVVVDVIRFSTVISARVAAGEEVPMVEMRPRSLNGAAVADTAAGLPHRPVVLAGCLRNAGAIADAVLALQSENGEPVSVAVIAGGELTSRDPDADLRFAIEDQLGVGAIVDALADRGIDDASPEATVAAAAFRAVRPALRHLLGASGSGRELVGHGNGELSAEAAAWNADAVAPRLQDGIFRG